MYLWLSGALFCVFIVVMIYLLPLHYTYMCWGAEGRGNTCTAVMQNCGWLHNYYVFPPFGGGGGGGGRGLRRGGSLVNFLQIGKGQTCFFVFQPGEGHSFLARKNYSMSLLFCSVQAKLPVKINLNYLQVSKIYISKNYLLLTNIIVSLDPCPLSPIF